MKTTVLEVVNGSDADKALVEKARQLIEQVTASKLFADKLMHSTMTEVNGLSNATILALLDTAHLSITVWLYSKWWSKVVGYTYFKTNTIYVNRKFFHGAVSVASNLLHEQAHILGFSHNRTWASSVPYVLNRIFEECCLELHLA